MKRGEMGGRVDVNHWRLTPLVEQRLNASRFDVKSLGGLLSVVQYGCSSLAKDNPPGIPILRMSNLQDEGWDLSSLKYIELDEKQLATYRLDSGDILFNRTNSKELVGKCSVFQESGDWVFASYLIRIRTNQERLLPQFASDFLAADIGRLQIDQQSRQIIGMTNINAEEIRELRIPLPPISEQQRLLASMGAARAERKKKLAAADALQDGLNDFVLKALGIAPPPEDSRRVFAVKLGRSRTQGQLNADFYHPERIRALSTLNNAGKIMGLKPLVEVVDFVREQVKAPDENYMSLAHVESHTGELTDSQDEASGNAFIFQSDDVLFARLRPYLNKVYHAEKDGSCSTEFHVLRVKDQNTLLPEYLSAILRSRLILAQTVHMMTGNTHPRLVNTHVEKLQIPIPQVEIQETIAAELDSRRKKARRLRVEAEAGWQEAKRWFEDQLLGN